MFGAHGTQQLKDLEPLVSKKHVSGQIIATSHDRFPPNGGLAKETPYFREI